MQSLQPLSMMHAHFGNYGGCLAAFSSSAASAKGTLLGHVEVLMTGM